MNIEELNIKRKKRKKSMSNKSLGHIFVIGVIYKSYDKKRIEAFKIYDLLTNEISIQSIETIKKRIENGERILGVHLNYRLEYKPTTDDYALVSRLVFDSGAYDIRKTDVLNGKGDVVTIGKSVIVGVQEDEHNDIFIIMNGNGEVNYITEEDAIENDLNGVINKRYICLSSCQQMV